MKRSLSILVLTAVAGLLPVDAWALPAVMTMEVVDVDGSTPDDPNEITVGWGAMFTIEFYLGGWHDEQLTGYGFGLLPFSFHNEGPVPLKLASFSCSQDDDCFAGSLPSECLDGICGDGVRCDIEAPDCPDGSECVPDPAGLFCDCYASFYIDKARADYVFSGLASVASTNCRWSDAVLQDAYRAIAACGWPGVPDQGERYYLGMLIVTMPSGACGDFMIALDPDDRFSVALNLHLTPIPLDLTSTITVHGPPCTDPGACCTGSVCTDGVTLGECEAGGGVFRGEDVTCGLDADGDSINDTCDNCALYNPDQADCQPNGIGDVCDLAEGTSEDYFPPRSGGDGVPDECQARQAVSTHRVGK